MNWDLTRLYRGFDDPAYDRDIEDCRALAERLLADGGSMPLEAVIEALKELSALSLKTWAFAQLTLAADANCAPAMAATGRVLPVLNRAKEVYSALSLRLRDADIEGLCAGSPLLKEHAYLLKVLKRDAAHVIDPALESVVLKMQLTGGSAWVQLRDQLEANLTADYEGRPIPLSSVRNLAYSPDAQVRRAAYEAELAAYPKIEIPMAACLNGIKGEANTLCALRHFDSVLDMALDAARMDRATLDALLTAMDESLPMFRRYFRLKAKLLGYGGGLKFWDLFAPVGRMRGDYTAEEARRLLTDELGAFSPRMGRMIGRAFDERWIDLYPREGKAGGAFCEGMHPLRQSFVLTNFDGTYSAVSTLAHELGHANQNECMNDVSILLSDYPMPLAETASIFNETLLAERMLEKADRDGQIALLEQQLSDGAQVIVDIYSRYLFESEVVERRKSAVLSAGELCRMMLDAQKRAYGDGLDPEALHPFMWACKSHYYATDVHFYNFPYAFGQLFALGVYAQYRQRGPAFLPDYERLLRDAGNGDIRDVAAGAGIDVADVGFWRTSLKVFEDKLDALTALTDNG